MIHPNAEIEELERLGSVSAPKSVPPCAPFESQEPFPLDQHSNAFFNEGEEPRIQTSYKFEPFVPTGTHFVNLTGQKIGLWTVISIYGKGHRGATVWLCLCDCGTWRVLPVGPLRNGTSKSCGCDTGRWRSNRFQARTVEYKAYHAAKRRCEKPNDAAYPHYGGRGIEFRFESFEQFMNELGKRPSPQHSIDRIDVNGHYEIGNVRWADSTTQARNKRTSRIITHDGETHTIAEWVEITGMSFGRIWTRLERGCCTDCIFAKRNRVECDHGDFPDPKSFEERLEAAFEFIPVGEEIDFEQLKNGIILED
jgi:hypothetical protein